MKIYSYLKFIYVIFCLETATGQKVNLHLLLTDGKDQEINGSVYYFIRNEYTDVSFLSKSYYFEEDNFIMINLFHILYFQKKKLYFC